METCSIDGCVAPVKSRGWCQAHYLRWHRHGDPLKTIRKIGRPPCVVPGCQKPNWARGYCSTHAPMMKKHGVPVTERSLRMGQGYVAHGGYRKVKVNGRYEFEHRLVMQDVLGRPLLPTEIVHHIDGDKLNNRPENLKLTTREAHRTLEHAQPDLPERTCTLCKQTKPAAAFNLRLNSAKATIRTRRRSSWCRACEVAYSSDLRRRRRQRQLSSLCSA